MTTWLAVGDETGYWDSAGAAHGDGGRLLGAALVLAPWPVWRSLGRERIDDRSLRERMGAPLQGLPSRYLSQGETGHHVMPALKYLRERGLHGAWSLATPADDPVVLELSAHLRWLAFHRHVAVLGAYGPLDVVRELHQGRDPAQALGNVYGLLTALILPFLDPGDELLVNPGPRSEPPDSLAWERARTRRREGDARQDTDLRGLITVVEDSARKALRAWDGQRLAELTVGALGWLSGQRQLGYLDMTTVNAVADLGAALLAMCRFPDYTVRLDEQALGANLGLFPLRDLMTG